MRNTPTHVGKTLLSLIYICIFWKHPHSRGEDALSASESRLKAETPPLTWGRHGNSFSNQSVYRNTPTHVGKTSPTFRKFFRHRKHPHSRGEDDHFAGASRAITETPPLTWGRLCVHSAYAPSSRNTPTHVGKTSQHSIAFCLGWKHPHSRGEDRQLDNCDFQILETPPLTWGRRFFYVLNGPL